MQLIKNYVRENYSLLFHHEPNNELTAIFDNKGFSFTVEAQNHYNVIKNQPHLYVAWTNDENGYFFEDQNKRFCPKKFRYCKNPNPCKD